MAAPEIFTENPRLPERPKSAPYGKPVSDAPFFPAKAPKSGPHATFSKFPVYAAPRFGTRDLPDLDLATEGLSSGHWDRQRLVTDRRSAVALCSSLIPLITTDYH